jgi:hypothetical protein
MRFWQCSRNEANTETTMQTAQTHLDSGMDTQIDIPALQVSWQAFDAVAHLRPIHSEAAYDRTVALMNALLEVAGDDEAQVGRRRSGFRIARGAKHRP